MEAATLRTTDPTYTAPADPHPLRRFAERFIMDPRDVPFLALMASATLVVIPFAVYLFLPGRFRWWLGFAYLALVMFGYVDRYILMLHNTSHRLLFRPRWRFMNLYIPWVLGPFFGESPETYFGHHLGMHHPENNLEEDLSSTMAYRRDRFSDFMRYWARFFFLILFELPAYLWRKKRDRLARRLLFGELTYMAWVGLMLWVNWRAALFVYVAPVLMVRFLMMAGNWGQHAFIDPARPANCYVNSITCIDTRYNRRCFNDGYHIGHHLRANRHWTEMPGELERNVATYAREGAVIFRGTPQEAQEDARVAEVYLGPPESRAA